MIIRHTNAYKRQPGEEREEAGAHVPRHSQGSRLTRYRTLVSIRDPNNWNTPLLQTIWACQAGKDVYVEKPCSHNVFESEQIVAPTRELCADGGKMRRPRRYLAALNCSEAATETLQKMSARGRCSGLTEIYMPPADL